MLHLALLAVVWYGSAVLKIGKAERNVFDVELEEFKKVVEGKAGNPPSAEDAVIATRLVEDIRAFDTYGK